MEHPVRTVAPRVGTPSAEILLRFVVFVLLAVAPSQATTIAVPGGVATIQAGLDLAFAGDVVEVAAGIYSESLVFPRSGAPGAPIVLRAAPGAEVVLDATGVAAANVILLENRSHIRIVGFEIRNHTVVDDGSAIRLLGSGTDVQILGNHIHEVRGTSGMAITVYGTAPTAISNLVIVGNVIHDIEAAPSEAITLNGNVDGFLIEGNNLDTIDNIAIDAIGGETDIQPNSALVARNGVIRGNTVRRANSSYEGGYAAGIYVDGGRDIVIENNWIEGSDLGIEVGAENAGITTSNVVVRNNTVVRNERAGIVLGGYAQEVGRIDAVTVRGNTLFQNNTLGATGQGRFFVGGGVAELWVQWVEDLVVTGNLVVAGPENVVVGSYDPGSAGGSVAVDRNLYWSGAIGSAELSWQGSSASGVPAWRTLTGFDQLTVVANPLVVDVVAPDLHLAPGSPAIDAFDPAFLPAQERDADLAPRRLGAAMDIGADESGALFGDGFETGSADRWSAQVPAALIAVWLPGREGG